MQTIINVKYNKNTIICIYIFFNYLYFNPFILDQFYRYFFFQNRFKPVLILKPIQSNYYKISNPNS